MATSPDLARLLAQNKISRREFTARMTAMGAAAAIPGVLASATALAETPKQGGILRAGLYGASSEDVLFAGEPICCATFGVQMHRQLNNTLVAIDENYGVIPELAETWEPSEGGKVWTFKLREGVEFHNGKTLDSKDVVDTINIHRGPDSKSPALSTVAQITDIKADSKNTVVFTLSGANADFPAVMTAYHLSIYPSGEHDKGIGTGPFMLVSFDPGVKLVTKRNPNYWEEGLPHFDGVESIAINDAATKQQALRTGEVDIIDHPDLKLVDLMKKEKGFQVASVRGTQHYTNPMRVIDAPFDNNDVRLAVKHVIPRDQIVETVLRGYGSVGNDHPIASLQRYFNKDLPQRQYDPDKVKFHLKKAGMENHVFQLHASDAAFTGCVDTAVLTQEAAAKAGMKIELVREQVDGYWTEVWLKKPWCYSYYGGRPTEDWMMTLVYQKDAAWNETFWSNERFEKLLVDARAELDDAKRREMYYEMQKILWEEGGQVIPMFADHVFAATDKLKYPEGPLAGNFELDGMRYTKRWWFA